MILYGRKNGEQIRRNCYGIWSMEAACRDICSGACIVEHIACG